ncbi:hypothetical protein M0804_009522 [Polistes exclamans]|nr:hypothetical protein M0804_009522 [Polistes exclamans]
MYEHLAWSVGWYHLSECGSPIFGQLCSGSSSGGAAVTVSVVTVVLYVNVGMLNSSGQYRVFCATLYLVL